MAVTPVTIYEAALTTTGGSTLATVPASTTWIITNIKIANPTASAVNVQMSINGVQFIPTVTINANSEYSWDGKKVVTTGKAITGSASSASVTAHISGAQIV